MKICRVKTEFLEFVSGNEAERDGGDIRRSIFKFIRQVFLFMLSNEKKKKKMKGKM